MPSPSSISAETAARIEAALDALGIAQAPGFGSLVILDGQVVHRSCRGLANLEYDIPITTSMPFHIASMSKQFAGFALAMVADRGLLDLDADIRTYLPYFPSFDGASISARQLAHHLSGLRDQWGELVLCGWRIDDVISTADCLALIKRMESLNFEPQHGFSYSNTGYTLMGELVLATTGKTLREFCAEELFEPLGMTDTHFHDKHDELVPGRAYSYVPKPDGSFTHAHLMYAVVGATSLHTTLEDLVRWDQNFYDRKVGSDFVFDRMRESGVLADGTQTGYAFGLFHDTYRGQRREHHSGGDAGFRTQGERYPELGLSVYVFANNPSLDPLGIATQLTDAVMDQLGLPEAELPGGGAIDEPARYAGHFINPATGFSVELTHAEDTLTWQGAPLTQLAPDVIAFRKTLRLEFSADVQTVDVSMMAMHPQRLVRYEPVTPTREQLAAYVGTYWSEELGTRYVIELTEDGLVARQREHGTMPLTPSAADSFNGTVPGLLPMAYAMSFDRDADGSVSSVRLTMPRTDNIVAKRVSP
jgi:CubicO group peptidase (beta-lactamase class C family)